LSDEQLAELEREEREALLEEEERDEFFDAAADAPRLRKELERLREELDGRTEERDATEGALEAEKKKTERAEGAADEARAEAARARRELKKAKAGQGEKKPQRMDYAPMWPTVDRLLKKEGRTVPDVCGDVLEMFGYKATEKQRNSMVVQYSKRKKRLTNAKR
jgi:septal ring factor EnvC (AmiA/AmiB activator)